jgi:hypothetical protein
VLKNFPLLNLSTTAELVLLGVALLLIGYCVYRWRS